MVPPLGVIDRMMFYATIKNNKKLPNDLIAKY